MSKNKVEFIPSVGPGYDDTSIRPWNKQNSKSRADGEYYSKYWDEAIKLKPKIISITSFNEWHEVCIFFFYFKKYIECLSLKSITGSWWATFLFRAHRSNLQSKRALPTAVHLATLLTRAIQTRCSILSSPLDIPLYSPLQLSADLSRWAFCSSRLHTFCLWLHSSNRTIK